MPGPQKLREFRVGQKNKPGYFSLPKGQNKPNISHGEKKNGGREGGLTKIVEGGRSN